MRERSCPQPPGVLQALASFHMLFMPGPGKARRKLCTLGECSLLTCSEGSVLSLTWDIAH